jgi:ankyrin repeat protein
VKIVRELLNPDAGVNFANEYGCTPIYAANLYGHVAVVRELLNLMFSSPKCY